MLPHRPLRSAIVLTFASACLTLCVIGCEYAGSFEEMRCSKQTECPEGSECVDGYCTEPVEELVASVEVEPGEGSVVEGESLALSATAVDRHGNELEDARITWTSSDAQVAAVDEEGRVDAHSPGRATITASSGRSSGAATITVEPVPADNVVVSPHLVELEVGQTEQLSATVIDQREEEVDEPAIEWETRDPDVAVVDRHGELRALGAGTTTVEATSDEISGEADVVVSQAGVSSVTLTPSELELVEGEAYQMRTTVRDANNRIVDDRQLDWHSSNEEVASVDDGEVTTHAAGEATIGVEVDGKEAEAALTVLPPRVASVALSPSAMEMQVNRETVVSAEPVDSNGEALDWADLTWQSSNEDVATVSTSTEQSNALEANEVLVTTHAVGTALITASAEGVERSTALSVINRQPHDIGPIEVAPSSATIERGQTAQLSASLEDDEANAIDDWNIRWSSDDETTVRVDADGDVFGVDEGAATITATVVDETGAPILDDADDPLAEEVVITVENYAIDAVDLKPQSATIEVEQSVELYATLLGGDQTVLDYGSVDWSSSDPGVATVDAGTVTGEGEGTATITATALDGGSTVTDSNGDPITAQATIQVDEQSVARVEITPQLTTVDIGGTNIFTAVAESVAGDPLDERSVDVWKSEEDGTTVAVSDLGDNQAETTGLAVGQAVIEAEIDGVSGYAAIVVENAPPIAEDDVTDEHGDPYTVNSDADLTIDVLENDADPDGNDDNLKVSAIAVAPLNGQASIDTGADAITYSPDEDFYYGTEQFAYEVEDEDGATATAWVKIDVVREVGPVAEASCAFVNDVVELDASNSTLPSGGLATIEWSLVDAPNNEDNDSTDIDDRHAIETTFPPNGHGQNYLFELELVDAAGNADQDQCTVEVPNK